MTQHKSITKRDGIRNRLLILSSIFILLSCGKDDSTDDIPVPTDVSAPRVVSILVKNTTNFVNGVGLEITFNQSGNEELISEYRVLVVNKSSQPSFDLEKSETVPLSNYLKVQPTGSNHILSLDKSNVDTDGTSLTESEAYFVYILSIADGVKATANTLSNTSSSVVLDQPRIEEITNIRLTDIGNTNNGSDLKVEFDLTSSSNIFEIRLFVLKKELADSFDKSKAESIVSDNYISLSPSKREVQLSITQADIEGNPIIDDIEYVVFALSVANSNLGIENILSLSSFTIRMQQITVVRTITEFINSGSGGISTDANGNVYMGNFGTTLSGGGKEVFLITPEGNVSVFTSEMNGASGNEFDTEGNLYQANITGGTINKIAPDGQVSTFASGIQSPIGVAFDSEGTLFVSACNSMIWKITSDGTRTLFSSSPLLNCANGLDIDNEDNIYTSNFNDGRVIKITPDGVASVFATLPGNNNAHLIFKDDQFYVAARTASQIYNIDLSGNVTLFVGTGVRGLGDGPLSTATVSRTNDFAFSPDGSKLYFNDKDPLAVGSVISPVVIRVIDFAK